MVCQAAVGQGEDGLGPKAFALVTPTLIVGLTDEVRAQVVMVMPMFWAAAMARAPMVAGWSTTTSRFPWSASLP